MKTCRARPETIGTISVLKDPLIGTDLSSAEEWSGGHFERRRRRPLCRDRLPTRRVQSSDGPKCGPGRSIYQKLQADRLTLSLDPEGSASVRDRRKACFEDVGGHPARYSRSGLARIVAALVRRRTDASAVLLCGTPWSPRASVEVFVQSAGPQAFCRLGGCRRHRWIAVLLLRSTRGSLLNEVRSLRDLQLWRDQ